MQRLARSLPQDLSCSSTSSPHPLPQTMRDIQNVWGKPGTLWTSGSWLESQHYHHGTWHVQTWWHVESGRPKKTDKARWICPPHSLSYLWFRACMSFKLREGLERRDRRLIAGLPWRMKVEDTAAKRDVLLWRCFPSSKAQVQVSIILLPVLCANSGGFGARWEKLSKVLTAILWHPLRSTTHLQWDDTFCVVPLLLAGFL